MKCEHVRALMDAFVDDELDHSTATSLQAHLTDCSACAALRRRRSALREALGGLKPELAPAGLLADVQAALQADPAGARPRPPAPAPARWRPPPPVPWSWRATLLALAAASGVLFGAGYWWGARGSGSPRSDLIVALHAAALGSRSPADEVQSSDRHVVKPWLVAQMDFAPPVPDLRAQGFRLSGARRERIERDVVAVLSYRIRNHLIDLFVWRSAASDDAAVQAERWRGFTVRRWREAGLELVAISDVDALDLQRFVEAVRRQQGAPAGAAD